MKPRLFFAAIVATCLLASTAVRSTAMAEEETAKPKVLIISGPSQHPPGTHEAAAGARLLEHCLKHAENIGPVVAESLDTWPSDPGLLEGVDSVVFIGDIFPPERMENSDAIMAQLTKLMDSGCGIVCVHYATGLRAEHVADDGDHPLLHWLGGYFATRCEHHRSVARVCKATLVPEDVEHPVLQGWNSFTFDDEPYWNNYFGEDGPATNVTPLVYAMLPPDAPLKETVVWAVERADGGRGVGIVVPHYYRNWQIDDLRKMVLNGIAWSAGMAVPDEGVDSSLSDLARFEPAAVQPQPRKKR